MRAALVISVVISVLAITTAVTGAAPAFHAAPAVAVVQTATSAAGTGTITLHNDGTTALTVGDIVAEAGCGAAVHLAPLTGFPLGVGATRALTVSCTAAPAGIQRCSYDARSTSGDVLLTFEAVCASGNLVGLSPSATTIDLGTVAIGAAQAQTVTVQNTSGAAVTQLAFETTDLDGNFVVQAPCNPDARSCDAQLTVASGASFPLTIACAPRSLGAHSAQLYLVSQLGTRLGVPIALSCTGVPASGPVLAVPPAPVEVGDVEVVGGAAAARIHLTNTGTTPLTLSDIQTIDAGTGAALDWTYTASNPCTPHIPDACVLSAGGDVALDLVFDPSAFGVRDAALLVNYHDTVDRSVSVPLRGRGQGATLELVGGAVIDFGTLPVGTGGKLLAKVTNRGTRLLSDAKIAAEPPAPFTIVPSTGAGPGFSVAANGTTTFTIGCMPTAAGTFTQDVVLTAPDASTPPIDLSLRCIGDDNATLIANPPALLLGDVRIDMPVSASTLLTTTGAQLTVDAQLATPIDGVSLGDVGPVTPLTLALTVAPTSEGSLADRIEVAPSSGTALAIPVLGNAVSPMASVPTSVSLGTFCVQEATTSRTLTLASTGSATIGVMAPVLASADSPFELSRIAPLDYPTTLPPSQTAQISVTPRRQATKGTYTDEVVWTTDVTGLTEQRTPVMATFVDQGVALAPGELRFDPTPIHLDIRNARQVTLQNCDVSSLTLEPPQVPSPFSIDSPSFPTVLLPNETVTFSVGFHPTKADNFMGLLTILSPQLPSAPLQLLLQGQGIASGGNTDGGTEPAGSGKTSFYACDSCATGDSSGLVIALAALSLIARRLRPIRAARRADRA